jgi:hypothetical protein
MGHRPRRRVRPGLAHSPLFSRVKPTTVGTARGTRKAAILLQYDGRPY